MSDAIPDEEVIRCQEEEIELLRGQWELLNARRIDTERRIDEVLNENERMLSTIRRISHFATGDCNMADTTRLKCIAGECKAELSREGE